VQRALSFFFQEMERSLSTNATVKALTLTPVEGRNVRSYMVIFSTVLAVIFAFKIDHLQLIQFNSNWKFY